MTKKIVRISAVYGNYNNVREGKNDGFEERILLTDKKDLLVSGWKTVHYPILQLEPRLQAKFPKMLPFVFAPDADVVVWTDGSIELTDDYVFNAARKCTAPLTAMGPSSKSTILQEYFESVLMEKYQGYELEDQVNTYLSRGLPPKLFGAGILVWQNTLEARTLGEKWFAETLRYSPQDQISLPYAVWATETEVDYFLGDVDFHDNPHWQWHFPNRKNWSSR